MRKKTGKGSKVEGHAKKYNSNPATGPIISKTYHCYGESQHPTNTNPEKRTNLHGERGSVLHPNALPHHPATVAEEVHGQGQNRTRRPCQEGKEPSLGIKPSTYGCKGEIWITKG